jgi:hypothetical protein
MQSKAFFKSQKMPPTNVLLFSAFNISLTNLHEAFSADELLLKRSCSFELLPGYRTVRMYIEYSSEKSVFIEKKAIHNQFSTVVYLQSK